MKIYTLGQSAKYHHVPLKKIKDWGFFLQKRDKLWSGRGAGFIEIPNDPNRPRYGFPENLLRIYPKIPDTETLIRILREAEPTFRSYEERIVDELIVYAKNNTDEGWGIINEKLALSEIANEPSLVDWGISKGIHDENEYVRDLGVSILEKSKHKLDDELKNKLLSLMQTDNNPYVQYRAAFTLFNRNIRSDEVIAKMNEALTDPDVKDIAQSYLSRRSA